MEEKHKEEEVTTEEKEFSEDEGEGNSIAITKSDPLPSLEKSEKGEGKEEDEEDEEEEDEEEEEEEGGEEEKNDEDEDEEKGERKDGSDNDKDKEDENNKKKAPEEFLFVLPLYSALPTSQQLRVFQPPPECMLIPENSFTNCSTYSQPSDS